MPADRHLALLIPLLLLTNANAADPLPPPDPPGAFARDRSFDMVRLDLNAELDPVAHSITGIASWTVARLGPGPLRLDAVAFGAVSVTVDDASVVALRGIRELTIPVPESAPGTKHTVVVHYEASPQLGLHWRGPPSAGGGPDSPDRYLEVYSQGEGEDNRYWFPCYDHPDDRFAYAGTFTIAGAPSGWTIVTNSGQDLTSYLVMVAAAPYRIVEGPENAVRLRAIVPPGTPDAWIRPILDPLPDMLAWFAERTGVPYAWGHYDQTVVQRFIYGGMENTSSAILTDRVLAPPSVQTTRTWVPSVIAHELAHQWFGDLLTARTAREMWLNEGFASFFAADWEVHAMRVREGEAAGDALAAAKIHAWRMGSLDDGGLAGRWFLGGGGATHAGAALGEASHNVYAKGAMVLTMLRRYLGEEAFWAGIRDYTRGHQHQSVETIDLQRAMEARSGKDLAWFFQQWTELPGVPKVSTSWAWTADAAGGGHVSVELHQGDASAPLEPNSALPIDISVDGGPSTRAWLRGSSLTVNLPAASPPGFVAIDPDGGLLVEWDQKQAPEAWAAQVARGSPYARVMAIRALADQPALANDPLVTLLADPNAPVSVRTAAAAGLGTRRTCAPLTKALRDPDERVRSAAASAIGQCPDRALVGVVLAALNMEPNSDIRSGLLRSAAAIDPTAVTTLARRTLTRPDALDPERATAADVLGIVGLPSDVPALLRTPVGRDVRLAGLRAAVKILRRQELGPSREALRVTLARSAERLLSDLDLRGIQGAIDLLRDVGDARSAAMLEALVRSTTVPDVARQARDAIPAITARVETVSPATPNEVDARLKAMEDRVKALEEGASPGAGQTTPP